MGRSCTKVQGAIFLPCQCTLLLKEEIRSEVSQQASSWTRSETGAWWFTEGPPTMQMISSQSPPAESCSTMSQMQFLSRDGLPRLAYHKLSGWGPGIMYLPGYKSDMNNEKCLALEKYCSSVGRAFVRFDYRGCGQSEGNFEDSLLGEWKEDVLAVLDGLTNGPQVKEEVARNGFFNLPSSQSTTGYYRIEYSFFQEAQKHTITQRPIPIKCPIRMLHGMDDNSVPWSKAVQLAENLESRDVTVVLRTQGGHVLKDEDSLSQLMSLVRELTDTIATSKKPLS
ncbi:hypothetical protein NDU88_006770 [Pleurodeles waltl]|uniref:Uncharacterized protein n=1 Tax=Pleurodeles waltl TaxID=8319 RepID=A0AAV7ULZ4_PLEWA|nr:hypothetical protein NDU88_006770 [Pleurodeles waltl]